MADPESSIQSLLDELVASGDEHGLQLAVYQHGDLVIDAWAGVADPATGTPVTSETLFTVYSVSKGITATLVHILAERGLLDYDDPIARYWPSFGQNGKEKVTVRHALTHTAGIPHMPPGANDDTVIDWDTICNLVAANSLLWPAGETLCYHALTYGWILGGVAERADGRTFSQLFEKELIGPLGLDGMYFGVPDSELQRVATLQESPELEAAEPSAIPTVAPRGSLAPAQMNRREVRQACLPAYGLCANARSLAKVYASLIGDGVEGVRLLPPARVKMAAPMEVAGNDANSGKPLRFGLGYGVGGPTSAMGNRPTTFGHGGYGGAQGYADPEYGLAVGLTKNRLVVNDVGIGATWRILRTVREVLGIPH